MKRRSFLQVLLGALVVPSVDTVLAKTGVPTRTPVAGVPVQVYEGEFGVSILDIPKIQEAQTGVTDLMRGMADEFRRDFEREIFAIAPKETPFVSRVQHSGLYHEWHTD